MMLRRLLQQWCPPLAAHLAVGKRGERIAANHLRSLGYRILGCNVRIGRHDEIDIVAFDPRDGVYVFCEVKSRARLDDDYVPQLNLTREKKMRMVRAARRYVAVLRQEVGYRLDTVCIADGKVTAHVEGSS